MQGSSTSLTTARCSTPRINERGEVDCDCLNDALRRPLPSATNTWSTSGVSGSTSGVSETSFVEVEEGHYAVPRPVELTYAVPVPVRQRPNTLDLANVITVDPPSPSTIIECSGKKSAHTQTVWCIGGQRVPYRGTVVPVRTVRIPRQELEDIPEAPELTTFK